MPNGAFSDVTHFSFTQNYNIDSGRHFVRGSRSLCGLMTRNKIKRNKNLPEKVARERNEIYAYASLKAEHELTLSVTYSSSSSYYEEKRNAPSKLFDYDRPAFASLAYPASSDQSVSMAEKLEKICLYDMIQEDGPGRARNPSFYVRDHLHMRPLREGEENTRISITGCGLEQDIGLFEPRPLEDMKKSPTTPFY